MASACIIVADGAHARFFTLDSSDHPELDGGPRLVEHLDLVNPEADAPARGLFSDRSGRGPSFAGGSAHGLDDHRDQHLSELERRFASRVVTEAERLVADRAARRLIVVAGPKLLGPLRAQLDGAALSGVEIEEVAEYMVQASVVEIHETLAARGLLQPPSVPLGAVYRARGQQPPASR